MPTPEFTAALDAFVAIADALVKESFNINWSEENRRKYPDFPAPELHYELGSRYARIVRGARKPISGEATEERSAYCFVDMANGDILMAASWKSPAKGKRGSIYDADHGRSAIDAHGARYLR